MAKWNVAQSVDGMVEVSVKHKLNEDNTIHYCNNTPINPEDFDYAMDWTAKEARIGDIIYLNGKFFGMRIPGSPANN